MGSLSTDTLWVCAIWPPTYPARPQGAGIQGERDKQNTFNAFPERALSMGLTPNPEIKKKEILKH